VRTFWLCELHHRATLSIVVRAIFDDAFARMREQNDRQLRRAPGRVHCFLQSIQWRRSVSSGAERRDEPEWEQYRDVRLATNDAQQDDNRQIEQISTLIRQKPIC